MFEYVGTSYGISLLSPSHNLHRRVLSVVRNYRTTENDLPETNKKELIK
jgi:hypothetical protein